MLSEWEKNAQRARRLYPEGTRIELINMNDPYHPVEEGLWILLMMQDKYL